MLSSYKQYKAHVAPIYQSEIDRHLFATASYRRRKPALKERKARAERLRARWLSRWTGWKAARAGDSS